MQTTASRPSLVYRGWRYFKWVAAKPHPARYLISRALYKHNWFSWMRFQCGPYVLKLHGTYVAWDMWNDPRSGSRDWQLLEAYLRPGDNMIDVGANIGTFTFYAASLVGASGAVFSIEPNPTVFRYLLENSHVNTFSNIRTFNVALGKERGSVSLSDKEADDRKFISTEGCGPMVRLERLDDLGIPKVPVALLKIDVEGYERFVLEGAVDTLKRTACVYYESNERQCARFGYSSNVLIRLFESNGFKIYRISVPGALEPIAHDYCSAKGNENLLAIRDVGAFLSRTGFSCTPNSL